MRYSSGPPLGLYLSTRFWPPLASTSSLCHKYILYQGKFRRAAGFCNGRRPDFEFLGKENAAVAFQRSTMRATRRARGITLEMWRLVHPACGRSGGRATDPIRRHVPVAMARRVGSRTVLCLRKSIFDAEFFRGTYFCTLLPGSQVRLAWKYLAAFLLFLHPLRICSLLEVSLVHRRGAHLAHFSLATTGAHT